MNMEITTKHIITKCPIKITIFCGKSTSMKSSYMYENFS